MDIASQHMRNASQMVRNEAQLAENARQLRSNARLLRWVPSWWPGMRSLRFENDRLLEADENLRTTHARLWHADADLIRS